MPARNRASKVDMFKHAERIRKFGSMATISLLWTPSPNYTGLFVNTCCSLNFGSKNKALQGGESSISYFLVFRKLYGTGLWIRWIKQHFISYSAADETSTSVAFDANPSTIVVMVLAMPTPFCLCCPSQRHGRRCLSTSGQHRGTISFF